MPPARTCNVPRCALGRGDPRGECQGWTGGGKSLESAKKIFKGADADNSKEIDSAEFYEFIKQVRSKCNATIRVARLPLWPIKITA